MAWVAVGATAIGIGASVLSSDKQSEATKGASQAQLQASEAGIAEERRQFDEIRELLSPYIESGNTALTEQLNLMGLGGPEAEAAAISRLEESPTFQSLVAQGEEGILQSASATGGLRGGNVQRALAEYRPQVLSGLINQRYDQLGGIARQGQASAAGQATLAGGSNIPNLLVNQGVNQANLLQAGAQNQATALGGISSAIGTGFGIYRGLNQPPAPQPVEQKKF